MNATIRAHHLGLAPPVETAGQFRRKIGTSLVIMLMAFATLVWQDILPFQQCRKNQTTKIKAQTAKTKIQNLFYHENH